MAAGLPVVMPDWDGFRDTVVDGVTGYLIPTRMAAPGTGAEIARRFADGRDGYLQYLTLVQAQVQIDVPHYAQAFEALIMDADLRKRMGQQAADHVRRTLDWSAIIPRYLALANDLGKVRNEVPPMPGINPLETDPFTAYQKYPTSTVQAEDIVALVGRPDATMMDLLDRLSARQLYKRNAVPTDQLVQACNWLFENGAASIAQLATGLNVSVRRTTIMVLILAKSDMVRLSSRDAPDPHPT
jgi:hypothetical protein